MPQLADEVEAYRIATVVGQQSFGREAGEALHPAREPPEMLDRRETHHLPRLLLQFMASEVVLVQAVHDQHDRTQSLSLGEVLGVADAEDLRTRLVAEAPDQEGDRGEVRLQIARRQVRGKSQYPRE
jgi:hypothetical protein